MKSKIKREQNKISIRGRLWYDAKSDAKNNKILIPFICHKILMKKNKVTFEITRYYREIIASDVKNECLQILHLLNDFEIIFEEIKEDAYLVCKSISDNRTTNNIVEKHIYSLPENIKMEVISRAIAESYNPPYDKMSGYMIEEINSLINCLSQNGKKTLFVNLPKNTEEYIHGIQTATSYMLREFIDVCENNNIRYYLHYGTLLGVIRHNDIFIPWDDDVDVLIFDEDVDKLINVINTQDLFSITRVVTDMDAFTPMVYYWIKYKNNSLPLYIDVFTAHLGKKNNANEKKCDEYLRDTPKILELRKKLSKTEYKTEVNKKFKELNDSLGKSPVNDAEVITFRMGKICDIFDSSIYEPSKIIKVNEINVRIPNDSEKLLSRWYGNYYSLPKNIGKRHSIYNNMSLDELNKWIDQHCNVDKNDN